jgi:hypothetical protein
MSIALGTECKLCRNIMKDLLIGDWQDMSIGLEALT